MWLSMHAIFQYCVTVNGDMPEVFLILKFCWIGLYCVFVSLSASRYSILCHVMNNVQWHVMFLFFW